MKRIVFLLAGFFLLLPLLSRAQVYRVEHLPAYVPARVYAWNSAKRACDYTARVEVPAGAEVKLLDTLEGSAVLVSFEGRKVRMIARDLAWAPELNEAGTVDRLEKYNTLAGIGHRPLHSPLGRWLYGYGAAWLIFTVLACISLTAWMRFVPAIGRIFVLTAGLVFVSLVETGWGALLAGDAGWLSDYEDLGLLRTFAQIIGFFLLVGWQVLLVKQAQQLICGAAGVDPGQVRLRWAVLAPVPVIFVVFVLLAVLSGGEVADWAVAAVLAAIAALELFFIVRYYRRLGTVWGTAYLLLFLALLLSTVVLIPLTVVLGFFVIGALLVVAVAVAAILWMLGDHVEKIGGEYYKVPNLPI